MKIAPVADVKARFSKYLKDCVEGPVVVTKNGRPAAVLVAVSDEEELERLILAHTPRFTALLEAASTRVKETGGAEHTEFWNSVGKKRRPSADR